MLEVFVDGASERLLSELIEITQEGPDRKGRHSVQISAKGGGKMHGPDPSRSLRIYVQVDESHAPEVLALIEEVNAASGD